MNKISIFQTFSALVAVSMSVLVACGGEDPGGSVGDACDTVGEDSECADGEICEAVEGFDSESYCLKLCTEQADCEAGESCNGLSGGTKDQKACSPKTGDSETAAE